MADLMGIGISGLLAYQRTLATTSHNISNANTEGYSRQRTELATRVPQQTGAGFIGQGVDAVTVSRYYDQFNTEQVRLHTSSNSQLQTYHEYASQVDNMLADPKSGLTPTLEEFFGAVQDVANDPTSAAAREVMVSQGEALTNRFHSIDKRLTDLQGRVNRQMEIWTSEINQMATSLAAMNEQIVTARGKAGGQPPNDLLDQRDLLLNQLSERVKVSVVEQDDGMMNVFIGNGQSLVVGTTPTELSVSVDPFDPSRREITVGGQGGQATVVTNTITGGTLGGAIDFQREVLEPTRKELGRVAVALSETFNDQHHLGTDLNGQFGGDFFEDIGTIPALASAYNYQTTDYRFETEITDPSKLTTSDYRLDYNAGRYTLTRLSDNQVVAGPTTTLNTTPPSFDLTGGLDPDDTTVQIPQFTITDDEGVDHTVDVTFTQTGTPNEWDMQVVLDEDPGLYTDTHTVTFDGAPSTPVSGTNPGAVNLAPFIPGGDANQMDMTIDLTALSQQASDATPGGSTVAQANVIDATKPPLWTEDGFQVNLDGGTNIADGDSWLIRPTIRGAEEFGMSLQNPDEIAARMPVLGEASIDNLGNGAITQGRIFDEQLYTADTYSVTTSALSAAAVGAGAGVINDDTTGTDNNLQYQLRINDTIVYQQNEGDPVLSDLNQLAAQINDDTGTTGVFAYVDDSTGSDRLYLAFDEPTNRSIRVTEHLVDTTAPTAQPVEAADTMTGYFGTALAGDGASTAVDGAEIAYDGTASGYIVQDSSGARVTSGTYQSGGDITFRGMTASISGQPRIGDNFTIGANESGISDNRNALALANLQTDNTMLNGTSDYQTVYAGMVASVGTKTHIAQLNGEVSQTMLDQAVAEREGLAGVNLDEEAANLLQFQQAYQATTKLISVADELFQTLLNATGR